MDRLAFAIQKSGRMTDESLTLLKECGISIDTGSQRLKTPASDFPMDILFLRNADIPQYVVDGVVHAAIVGENVIIDHDSDVEIIHRLGFSRCRLSLALPKAEPYESVHDLEGKKIATSYPNSLKAFLKSKGVSAFIHEISGSVEIAPNIGLSDAICDLVSTGSTLLKNGLKEVETIYQSEAVLIANKHLTGWQTDILNQLHFRIKSIMAAKANKYILLNAPNDKIDEIAALLPGMKSPTVMPLAESGWSSIHSVITEKHFWEIIGQLKSTGAQGILIIPIEKMIL